MFDEDFADKFAFDVLDPTKLIPEDRCRSHGRPAGARPHASTTSSPRPSRWRSARRTSCPGIDFTNDPLLQGRNFSYLDTQIKRLGGPNFTHIPINAPKCPFAQFPAGRPHGDAQSRRAAPTTSPTRWGDGRPARERRSAGFRPSPSRVQRRQRCACAGDLRRPLQPGPAVLHQPDRRSSRSTSRDALMFELSKVRDAGDPGAHGLAPAQHRRRARADGGGGLQLEDAAGHPPRSRPART